MKKRIIVMSMIIATIFTLVGCGNKEDNKEVLKVEDVFISQPDNTYYRKDKNGNLHSSNDAILISTYNDYQCVDTNIEFDEETGKYTCTIEFKKIIE